MVPDLEELKCRGVGGVWVRDGDNIDKGVQKKVDEYEFPYMENGC